MRSVLDVFANNRSGRRRIEPLYLGSVKANLGHAESGSGVTSLIKIMLMMKYNEIPPHVGIKTRLNTKFPADLTERGIRIAMEPTQWHRGVGENEMKRMAFLNNFSAAGGNSALLLEDAPYDTSTHMYDEDKGKSNYKDPRDVHLITISARTPNSLYRNAQSLASYLSQHPSTPLASLSYTTTARRIHHNHRLAVRGKSVSDVRGALEKVQKENCRPMPRNTPDVAFAFTGQGSTYKGMGKQLIESFSVFREELLRLASIARSFGFDSFMPLLLGQGQEQERESYSPQAMQLALTCFQIALAQLWNSFGITPSVVIGHSLGEYAALQVAGVLSARDAVFLVGTRARLLAKNCEKGTHAMLAVRASEPVVINILEKLSSEGQGALEVACVNGPSQTVVAGLSADVEHLQELLAATGTKATKLRTDFAFHSTQVEPILDEFGRLTRGVMFDQPRIPMVSPILSGVIARGTTELSNEYLVRHCRETVDFSGAVQSAIEQNLLSQHTTLCLEIGPDSVVTSMLRGKMGSSTQILASVRRNDSRIWSTLSDSLSAFYLAGITVQWGEYYRDLDCFHRVLELPTYQWDYKKHWIQYIHDWSLRKGEPAVSVVNKKVAESGSNMSPAGPPQVFLSATCQAVISSATKQEASSVTVASDLSHPDFRAVFESHKVHGAMLCPSSAYADMAMTLGNHLLKLKEGSDPSDTTHIEVAEMLSSKPLIMNTSPAHPQMIHASASADWASQTARFTVYSVHFLTGAKIQEHASCIIRFGSPSTWLAEWKRSAYLVRSRMQSLRVAATLAEMNDDASTGCHLIRRHMAYRLFANFVEYADRFQGLESVVLDSTGLEAMARVVLKDRSSQQTFRANPYHIDSLGHLSGFVMNATEAFDHREQVFINHGWESMRCVEKLDPDTTYHTYVKMRLVDGSKSKYAGDVYIFRGDNIIGVNVGVTVSQVITKQGISLNPNPPFQLKGLETLAHTSTFPFFTLR
jgi:naphtho-gamma-pyrone polyketide synthase